MPENYDDPYDDDDDADVPPKEVDPITKLRQQNRSLNKELKAERSAREELAAFKAQVEAERKEAALTAAAESAGIRPEHARLFAQLKPDVEPSREEVLAFAREYGLAPGTPENNAAAATVERSFRPVEVGGALPVQDTMTREEWVALQATDWQAAEEAYSQGRVTGLAPRGELRA